MCQGCHGDPFHRVPQTWWYIKDDDCNIINLQIWLITFSTTFHKWLQKFLQLICNQIVSIIFMENLQARQLFKIFISCSICSLGLKCPVKFSLADHYISTLSVFPGYETCSHERIKRICDSYAVSSYYKDIDLAIQDQNNLQTLNTECGSNVCCSLNLVNLKWIIHVKFISPLFMSTQGCVI